MKYRKIFFLSVFLCIFPIDMAIADTPLPSNNMDYPTGWQNWATIAVSHRTDNGTIRLILGNDIAIEAARSGEVNPWPDGAILGKVVWKDAQLENWKSAIVPGELVHAEFMFKDSRQFADTSGWGWGRWIERSQRPFNEGAGACIACHTPVKKRDWVFTDPAIFPDLKSLTMTMQATENADK